MKIFIMKIFHLNKKLITVSNILMQVLISMHTFSVILNAALECLKHFTLYNVLNYVMNVLLESIDLFGHFVVIV